MQTGNLEIKKIKCLVVDDEVVARKGIIRELQKNIHIDIVGEANSVESFQKSLAALQPDLVFLDIMLCDENILEHLAESEDFPLLVFVSAYPAYACNGFDLNAVDYLLKPVSSERLSRSTQKAYAQFLSRTAENNKQLCLKSNGKYYLIQFNDICFVEGMQNYVVVHCRNQKLICKATMTYILKTLPAENFLQVHRSYIVNLRKIESLDNNTVYIGEKSIPISRDKKKEVHARILGRFDLANETVEE